jgi:hypothetical protein
MARHSRVNSSTIAGQDNKLTAMGRDAFAELYDLFRDLDRRIPTFDKKIEQVSRNSEHAPALRNPYTIFTPFGFFTHRSFMRLRCMSSPQSTTQDGGSTGVGMSVSLNAIKASGISNTGVHRM